ncbi:hypothetical protein GLOIN_2v1791036 [Rhizophagus irregularis DAOM 181602=DAOM 197198]|uniref:Uncharacterized protein n=1 Tax=Rhizophagus irregularis (strain DAOM 181602 / DAOM 197198 / MUCL 43194) TaxID=747089 RepID=A0A2P4NXV0_RHIID|nr:hypothetical protein GLOIN_2v1791036 [Rhizophagus irregularis DAOM 181602=DAOM 197198]POG57972.1 hypothetical protein GLOIN_2v1791036 [Rhizophagus irregularis DAOM 181602=DAOM 197198]|eukprot:XP_025164838.1 hypothetical protein GLOIN_2v1791036 [Rhizophagus irregularis DAOM 181602=DAOM 197198]
MHLYCDSPIESGYYSNRLKKPPICYYCGKNNSLVEATDDLLHGYQSVYPLCSNCQLSGHSFHTWDIKVGTDNMGNIICLSFHSASNRVAEELSSEEKAINKKKSKEKSERLLKSIMWEYNM